MNSPQKYLASNLQSHHPYKPGIQPKFSAQVLKLNTNENPYPPSKFVSGAILEEVQNLRLYPNPASEDLRRCIADLHGFSEQQVIIGNGSDDILNLCMRSFSDQKLKAGMLDPSYSLYEVLSSIQGSEIERIVFKSDDFELPVAPIIDCGANIFFLTNPHAPSGREYAREDIKTILENFNGLVVIDEAYVDFAQQNSLALLGKFENLIISRTLSKSYSLAGLRVGYALSSAGIISILDQAREVYNVDRLAQAGAIAAIKDQEYFTFTKSEILKQRDLLLANFNEWGWKTIPSGANFLFTQPLNRDSQSDPKVARDLYEFLSKNEILVRYFPLNSLTSSYLRISIGKPTEMSILVEKIKQWQVQEKQK
tara:strand:- start:1030 stop:2130 length:1101 start_codon:yes stop_codon:yes gene_type:complete